MCNYQDLSIENSKCILNAFVDDYDIDSNGYCVLHSHDIAFKKRNNFTKKISEYINFQNDETSIQSINLIGVYFIPKDDTQSASKSSTITIRQDFDHINKSIDLRCSVFHGGLGFIKSNIQSDINLSRINCKEGGLIIFNSDFKGVFNISKCNFNFQVYIQKSRFEHSFYINDSKFARHFGVSTSTFKGVFHATNIIELDHGMLNSLKKNTFHHYLTFKGSDFEAGVLFEENEFRGELHLDDVKFRGPFTFHRNKISDKVFITSSNVSKKIFETSANIPLSNNKFDEHGIIIFKNVNIYHIDNDFKSNLKEYIHREKVVIGPGCAKYRNYIAKDYVYSTINMMLVEDMKSILQSYLRDKSTVEINIEISVDLNIDVITLVFISDSIISDTLFNTEISNSYKFIFSDASEISEKIHDTIQKNRKMTLLNNLATSISDDNVRALVTSIMNDKSINLIFANNKLIQEMKIENQNIYGGHQQFATTIINSHSSLSKADEGILRLIDMQVPEDSDKLELIDTLSKLRSENSTENEKSGAQNKLKLFVESAVKELGKESVQSVIDLDFWSSLI